MIFKFGKYKGGSIEDCDDINYIEFYYSVLSVEKDKIEVGNILLKKNDSFALTDDGQIVNAEEVELNKNLAADETQIHRRGYIDITFTRNCDATAHITQNGITFMFPSVMGRSYNGHTYYLPVFNQKAKQIKNISFRVNVHPTRVGDSWPVKSLEQI